MRLSTKYALQRSLTLEGILITDSHKLRPYKLRPYKLRPHKLRLHKLCLYKLRPYKLRPHKLRLHKLCLYKLRLDKLRLYKLRPASKLNKNLHRQPQGIKHLKFLKLPYLNLCL